MGHLEFELRLLTWFFSWNNKKKDQRNQGNFWNRLLWRAQMFVIQRWDACLPRVLHNHNTDNPRFFSFDDLVVLLLTCVSFFMKWISFEMRTVASRPNLYINFVPPIWGISDIPNHGRSTIVLSTFLSRHDPTIVKLGFFRPKFSSPQMSLIPPSPLRSAFP